MKWLKKAFNWFKSIFTDEVIVIDPPPPLEEPQTITPSDWCYSKAMEYLGVSEGDGDYIIENMFYKSQGKKYDSSVPWCSAFMNAVYVSIGYKSTKSLWARSHLSVGKEVSLDRAVQGDIVILWRKKKHSQYGHVGFYHKHNDDRVWLLGGNQSNKVCIKSYNRKRLLGVRRLT